MKKVSTGKSEHAVASWDSREQRGTTWCGKRFASKGVKRAKSVIAAGPLVFCLTDDFLAYEGSCKACVRSFGASDP